MRIEAVKNFSSSSGRVGSGCFVRAAAHALHFDRARVLLEVSHRGNPTATDLSQDWAWTGSTSAGLGRRRRSWSQ